MKTIMKKVIFLDIDGVLNSVIYDRIRSKDEGNIDVTRLCLIKKIICATGAQIVLSSSWRRHWEVEIDKCDTIGREINSVFGQAGIRIHDKTLILQNRAEEITEWLASHPDVHSYVILDDTFGGWGVHESRLVKTNSRIGRGLEERHVDAAIKILNGGSVHEQ